MSSFFYGYFVPEYLFVLFLTICVNYTAAVAMARKKGLARKIYFGLGVLSTLSILFVFKYFDFALQTVGATATLGLLLPIGLSFHTFQNLSYITEVYRGRQKPEPHLGYFALYVMFFPQLVAGPIERPQNLLPQIHKKMKLDAARLASGLRLIVWGLFQKTVVADRLGIMVDHVFHAVDKAPPEARLIAILFFAFQIYADFQGYTNIARGSARLLGFELMKNFARPYEAFSVTDFWRRWHISLSSWFRDYVYIPLGGNRGSELRICANLLFTFALAGLWHGANWTFVVWGVLNGAYVAIERWVPVRSRLVTFLLISFSWIFFRASTLSEAQAIIASIPAGLIHIVDRIIHLDLFNFELMTSLGTNATDFCLAALALAAMEIVQRLETKNDLGEAARRLQFGVRWASYAAFTAFIVLSWIFFPAASRPFIYFQF